MVKHHLDPEKVRLSEELIVSITKTTGRSCGDCSMCCKLLKIAETDSPAASWCKHAQPGCGGCAIYQSRPDECRAFACLWLIHTELGEHWKPSRSKMVIQPFTDKVGEVAWTQIQVHVDPASPNNWNREPYRSDLMAMSNYFLKQHGMMTVIKSNDRVTHAVLPDRIEEVGSGCMTVLPEPTKQGGVYYHLVQHVDNDAAIKFKTGLDAAKQSLEDIRLKDPALFEQLQAEAAHEVLTNGR